MAKFKTSIQKTTEPTRNYNNIYRGRKEMMFNNFLGGITWALGATLGLSIIIFAIGFLAKNVNVIPFIGEFVSNIMSYVLQHNPQLGK